jgi:type 1 glutamine amidotransferase
LTRKAFNDSKAGWTQVFVPKGFFLRLKSLSFLLAVVAVTLGHASDAPGPEVKFRIVAIAEPGEGQHQQFVQAAKIVLQQMAAENNFAVDYISNTEPINDAFLAKYRLFIQLNYPPYRWTPVAKQAFIRYITRGKGGWVGFHHATLLGDFDGYAMWPWFSKFMGDIRFTSYIPQFATATVNVEDPSHPAMKGLPSSFAIKGEEWYTWSKSPRAHVHVLASVDESTYDPKSMITMGGDHPVIWTNEHVKARNIYIFMGHRPELFQNEDFTQLFKNAILWGAGL